MWEKTLLYSERSNFAYYVADFRSSVIELLTVDGLESVQKVDMEYPVLDVAFCRDVMYASLDRTVGSWIVEYRKGNDGWTAVDTKDRWRITKLGDTKVELFWLEKLRKRAGAQEDE